jgi:hypothetical protein
LTVSVRVFWALLEMVFPSRRDALWLIQVTVNSGTRLAATRTRKCFQRNFMTPPVFRLDRAAYKAAPFLKIEQFIKLIYHLRISAMI